MGFVKGASGNAAGRPKKEDCAAEAIRRAIKDKDWETMAKSLYDVVTDPDAKGKDKAACYNAIADRAFGKAIQKQIVQELPAPPIDSDQIKEMQRAMGFPITEENE